MAAFCTRLTESDCQVRRRELPVRVRHETVQRLRDLRPENAATESTDSLPDGLQALRAQLSLAEVMRLIERTARWVHPDTFTYLPVWYPEHARGGLFYKANWTKAQMNQNRRTGVTNHKSEGNVHANKALTLALGLRAAERPNWSCCHIWGVDDDRYQAANAVVQDRRFFSCVANMVLLPTPLKAFTDVMIEVKMMLRVCVLHLHGFKCDHEAVANTMRDVAEWSKWDAYPESWPKPGHASLPAGTHAFSHRIKEAADRRMASIRSDLKNAGPFYPREEVRAVLDYWRIRL